MVSPLHHPCSQNIIAKRYVIFAGKHVNVKNVPYQHKLVMQLWTEMYILRYINSYLHVGMLVDMLSHFSGTSNAVQGADPGVGGEVSNSSNQVLYDQGTVQKCYMLLKVKLNEKLVNVHVFLEFSISFKCTYHVTLIYKLKNVNGVISIVACF